MQIKFKSEKLLEPNEDGSEGTCEFTGVIVVDVPPHHERSKFLQEVGVNELAGMSKVNREDIADMIAKANKATEVSERASKLVFSKVVSCDLIHSDGETRLSTPDELWSHPDATPLVEGLISKFTTNFASGKTKPS